MPQTPVGIGVGGRARNQPFARRAHGQIVGFKLNGNANVFAWNRAVDFIKTNDSGPIAAFTIFGSKGKACIHADKQLVGQFGIDVAMDKPGAVNLDIDRRQPADQILAFLNTDHAHDTVVLGHNISAGRDPLSGAQIAPQLTQVGDDFLAALDQIGQQPHPRRFVEPRFGVKGLERGKCRHDIVQVPTGGEE